MNSTTAAFSPLLDKIHSISPDPPLALAKEVEQLTENLDKLFQQHSSFDISPYKRRCQQAQDELTEMISAIENEKAASLANAPRSTRVKAALEQYRDKLQSLELGLAPDELTYSPGPLSPSHSLSGSSTTSISNYFLSSGPRPVLTDDDFGLPPSRRGSSRGESLESSISGLSRDFDSTHLNETEIADHKYHPDLETRIDSYTPFDLSGLIIMKAGPPDAFGGYASVHRGYLRGEQVAIKILKFKKSNNKGSDPEVGMKRRFKREIGVWGVLSQPPQPHILELYGFVKYLGSDALEYPAIISKWCVNGSAARYLEMNPNMLQQKKVQLTLDTAKGLAHLHSYNVIHGDLKPANILVNEHGIAHLSDFGLASLTEWKNSSGLATTSQYGGTAKYKAPELFPSRSNRKPKPSKAGDIWALGCVLYEFVYRQYPYHDLNDIAEILDAIKEKEPPAYAPEGSTDPFTIDLWGILTTCWDQDPRKRGDVNALIGRLEKLWEISV